jgi:DNA-binding LytR/AlgR family response regulator
MQNRFLIEDQKANEMDLEKFHHRKFPIQYENRKIGFVEMLRLPEKKKRKRLVAKRGIENIPILLEDIALFYTENKIVYAIDHTGKKNIVERNLSELVCELDDNIFFRVNRQYVININHVKSFKVYEKVKLKIDLKMEELNAVHIIIISQETAPSFKKWIRET